MFEWNSIRILTVCVIAFILQSIIPGFTEIFVLKSADVLARPWILITSMFLHGDFNHLFSNMFVLGLFGSILERVIGGKRFLMVYFIGGIIASIGASLFYSASLGASGAIFAILGTLVILRPRQTVFIGFVPMPMIVAAFVWIAIDLIGFLYPAGIANAAHLFGMAVGLLYGLIYRKKFGSDIFQRKRRQIPEPIFKKWEDRWMSIV